MLYVFLTAPNCAGVMGDAGTSPLSILNTVLAPPICSLDISADGACAANRRFPLLARRSDDDDDPDEKEEEDETMVMGADTE